MAAVQFETRVAGPVPASVFEELENIEVVNEAVGTSPGGPRAEHGLAGRHHQPAAALGQRTVRYSTAISPGVHRRHGKGMTQRPVATVHRPATPTAASGRSPPPAGRHPRNTSPGPRSRPRPSCSRTSRLTSPDPFGRSRTTGAT